MQVPGAGAGKQPQGSDRQCQKTVSSNSVRNATQHTLKAMNQRMFLLPIHCPIQGLDKRGRGERNKEKERERDEGERESPTIDSPVVVHPSNAHGAVEAVANIVTLQRVELADVAEMLRLREASRKRRATAVASL